MKTLVAPPTTPMTGAPSAPQPTQPVATQAAPPPFSPEVMLPYEQMVDASLIDAGQAPALGPPDAPVVIYEFTDYQCAPCNRAHDAAKVAWEGHREKVHFVVFNYPIDVACNPRVPVPAHHMACHAASVAVCAEEQGRFWEVADALHMLQGALDPLPIRGAATKAGVDLSRLDQCMLGERPRQRLAHDLAQAARLSIDRTPVFIVNGRMIPGNPGPRLEAMVQYLIENDGRWPQSGP